MPPGTGDIQLTLSQSACISGAVIVTTPHTLSLVDAAKGNPIFPLLFVVGSYNEGNLISLCVIGVAMFEELKVPTLAVVRLFS